MIQLSLLATDEGIAVDTMILVIAVLVTVSLVAVTTNKTKIYHDKGNLGTHVHLYKVLGSQ